MATKENVTIRQFTMGRSPQPAAPRPMPVSTASEMGVKRTRVGPNSLMGSPVKSVAIVMTFWSRRISSATASSRARWNVISRMIDPRLPGEHVDEQIFWMRERALLGEGHRLVEIAADALLDCADLGS